MQEELSRRDFLKSGGVAALAAAAGCDTHSDSTAPLLAGGDGGNQTTTLLDGRVVVASGYSAAASEAESAQLPFLALTGGNWFVFGASQREGYRMSNLQLEFGVRDYEHAQELLDRRPALMFTTDGYPLEFRED